MTKDKRFLDLEQIPYDMRSSCFVNAGSYYGTGKRNPVGTKNEKSASPIPEESYKEDVYKKIYTNEEKTTP